MLRDIAGSQSIDMSQSSSYTFSYSGPRQFEIASSITGVDAEGNALPTEYELSQNYPNPFNPTTTFRYALPEASQVSVKVYNMLGKEVATLAQGHLPAGYHTVVWDAASLPSGIYFSKLIAGSGSSSFTQTRKVVLLK